MKLNISDLDYLTKADEPEMKATGGALDLSAIATVDGITISLSDEGTFSLSVPGGGAFVSIQSEPDGSLMIFSSSVSSSFISL
ncbi:MAG TPA: hypothetical protein V6D12_07515 [Candidatus Obscuribacterales bacterium]